MMDKCMLLQIELYKNYVLSCLMDKYGMNAHDARKAILKSYLLDSLAEFPEETIHVDVETTADDIYFDYYKIGWKLRGD